MLRVLTIASAAACLLAGATVIDRIAVIVDKHAIKSSDIDKDLRMTQFMNHQARDTSKGAKRKAADRLIDQTIIRDEIAKGGYRRPSDADAQALVNQLRRDRFGGVDARMRQELSRYGLSEASLQAQFLWQLTVLRFIDQRFRPGVMISDKDVRAYYDKHLADLKREYPKDSTFATLEPKIRASLEGEQVNQNFTRWLDSARKRSRIEEKQGAFE